MDTIFIFSICFSFWPVGLNIDQEAVNIFIFLKKSVHKCSVKKKKKKRAVGKEDCHSIGAIVQVAINE